MKFPAIRTRSAMVALSLFALFASATGFAQSAAQQPAPKKAGAEATTLRITTRAVQVSVIAQDKDGHPVTGLTKNDFVILDQGTPQKIVSFAQQSSRITASIASTGTQPPANTFSNHLDQKTGVPPSVTVILLDALNSDFNDMAFARSQIAKFLEGIQPEDRVAIYSLTSRLVVLHDFTSDTGALLRALGKIPKGDNAQTEQLSLNTASSTISEAGSGGGGGAADGNANAFQQAIGRAAIYDLENNVEKTAAAFDAIAHHLARLPGRKNLVWVSGSFPFRIMWQPGSFQEAPSFAPQVLAAAHALSDANVAIYPVDSRGLLGPGMPQGSYKRSAPPQLRLDTMQSLAQGTGGTAFYNTNDIAVAIRRAIDDSSLTYELAYYPTHDQWDGRFREIKVEVKRPGVHLRYRKGYFATPAEQRAPESQGQLLAAAARNPLEATELGLTVNVDAANAAGARQIKVEVRVDPDRLHFELNGGHWTDNVEVAWIELGADGNDLGHSARTLRLNIPDQIHEKIGREGLVFNETISLIAESVELRLVVRDAGTGAIGSVNIPLTRLFPLVAVQAPPKK